MNFTRCLLIYVLFSFRNLHTHNLIYVNHNDIKFDAPSSREWRYFHVWSYIAMFSFHAYSGFITFNRCLTDVSYFNGILKVCFVIMGMNPYMRILFHYSYSILCNSYKGAS
jgi:hypothetical protein